MVRESKAKSEVEKIILELVQESAENGELVESVHLVLFEDKTRDASVGVGWREMGEDMRPAVTLALTLAVRLCREFDVKED